MNLPADVSALQARAARYVHFWQQDPANVELFRLAFDSQLQLGAYASVQHLLNNPPAALQGSAELHHRQGLYEMAQGQFAAAEASFKQALLLNPQAREGCLNLAYAHALQGRYDQAHATLGQSGTLTPARMTADEIYLRARIDYLRGDLAAVIELATHGLAQAVCQDSRVAGLLSAALIDDNQPQTARYWAEQALQWAPDACAYATLGTLALDSNQRQLAEQGFGAALALDPQSGRAWFGMAMCHVLNAEAQAATAALHQASRFFAGYIGTWHLLGWRALAAAEVDEAASYFERALQLNRNFADTHGGLAVVAIQRGQLSSAAHQIEAALRLDSLSSGALYAQALLWVAQGDPRGQPALDQLQRQSVHGHALMQSMLASRT